MNGVRQNAPFYFWLLSHSVIILRFIYVVVFKYLLVHSSALDSFWVDQVSQHIICMSM